MKRKERNETTDSFHNCQIIWNLKLFVKEDVKSIDRIDLNTLNISYAPNRKRLSARQSAAVLSCTQPGQLNRGKLFLCIQKKSLRCKVFQAKKKRWPLYQDQRPFMWNNSKTNTIPGYRFAIQLSFCNGCIWVQNRCGWVQIVAQWVQHRAFVFP